METINYPETVKARKDHMCDWCGQVINKGEKYQYAVYKYDDIYSWKNHLRCMELALTLKMEGYEGITEDIFQEYITEEFKEIWIKIDVKHYESKDFVIPSFKDQLEFVYKHRCKK